MKSEVNPMFADFFIISAVDYFVLSFFALLYLINLITTCRDADKLTAHWQCSTLDWESISLRGLAWTNSIQIQF